jgi:hypothetical protein
MFLQLTLLHKLKKNTSTFEVLTALNMKTVIFWDVMRSMLDPDQRF